MELKWGLTPDEVKIWLREYDAGIDAAERGVERFKNPHVYGSIARRAWDRGWHIKDLLKGDKVLRDERL